MSKLEIACFTLQSAKTTIQAQVDRIEFCADISTGGITPSIEDTQKLLETTDIPIYIMIRPRGGDYVYSSEEFQQMKEYITQFKKLGVSGFVFGILSENNTIDIEKNKELVQLANPFPCTFHRAFDRVSDFKKAFKEVIACGFSTILTSGLHQTAFEGINVLQELHHLANSKITIMPGGSIRSTNISTLKNKINADFFHSSGILSQDSEANFQEIIKLKEILYD